MLAPALPPLSEWETFYVITGSSAAALTGLMFVVVALRAEAMAAVRTDDADRAFSTPTIVHFCGVLLLAAILSTPGHTPRTLAACVGATGIAGAVVSARVGALARRQKLYAMVLSDWTWHVAIPLAAYLAAVAAAVVLPRRPAAALYVIAGAALLLLFVGIHNAWDSALYLAVHRFRRDPLPGGTPVTRRIVRDGAPPRRVARRPKVPVPGDALDGGQDPASGDRPGES